MCSFFDKLYRMFCCGLANDDILFLFQPFICTLLFVFSIKPIGMCIAIFTRPQLQKQFIGMCIECNIFCFQITIQGVKWCQKMVQSC